MKNTAFFCAMFCGLLISSPVYAELAEAMIKATKDDSPVKGRVVITEKDEGIAVEAAVENVPPGKHGLHFHEIGKCDDEGKAAGGHFNPEKTQHGFLPKDGRLHAHSGDMGNIDVGADGRGRLDIFLPGVYLTKTPSVGGLSVVLHEKQDDFSQPAGNAAGRIGCGVIELKNHLEMSASHDLDEKVSDLPVPADKPSAAGQ